MAESSRSSQFRINFHHGGTFDRTPGIGYEFDMVGKIDKVDLCSMDFREFSSFLSTECTGIIVNLFYLVPGKDLDRGLRDLTCDKELHECVQLAQQSAYEIDIYASHTEFKLNENYSSEDDDELYDSYSSDEDETASLDHLSDGDDEVHEIRVQKVIPKPKKKGTRMFDENFLSRVFSGLPSGDNSEKNDMEIDNVDDQDKLGVDWPIHDPTVKWKFMQPVLGERYEDCDQLKRCLTFYALANGYQIYFEINSHKKLLARCGKDNMNRKCPFRLWASWMQHERSFQIKSLQEEHACSLSFEHGNLISSNWIARNYAHKLMLNPCMKIREIQDHILKKYKCKVSISLVRRGKVKALKQYENCLEDHYAMLRPYALEILQSNPGSSCMISVETLPDGKSHFKSFYVCFKGLKDAWLAGCRRVIGLDGCFLKTVCKGELLSAVGRDGNNQIFPIAWAVVNVENKENWTWFMKCLIEDLGFIGGEHLTIISDQHKGIVEAAKEVMPLAEHRQCARHIYANFRKRFNGVIYRNLFWKAAKATFPAKFESVMQELQNVNKDAYKHLMERNHQSWSRAYFTTDKACDAVENGISECFNAMIVDARRKPIINMLEDIRIMMMERLCKMRMKHMTWVDGICPSIRKKLELAMDKHRQWKVIPAGETRFEVMKGKESFRVDERARTCTCRGWQVSGIPCEHGCAALYFLHNHPEAYVSNWYSKYLFVTTYNHYIEGMNGMDQWPSTDLIKPLPPVVRKMPGRPKKKRRKDNMEGGDGKARKLTKHGSKMHCKGCKEPGHNIRACPSRPEKCNEGQEQESVSQDVTQEPVSQDATQEAPVNQDSTQELESSKKWSKRAIIKAASPPRGGVNITGGLTVRGSVNIRGGLTDKGGVNIRGGMTVRGGVNIRGRLTASAGVASRVGKAVRGGLVKPRRVSERLKIVGMKRRLPPGPGLTPEDQIFVASDSGEDV